VANFKGEGRPLGSDFWNGRKKLGRNTVKYEKESTIEGRDIRSTSDKLKKDQSI